MVSIRISGWWKSWKVCFMRLFSSYAANRVHAVSAQRATIKFRYFNLSGSEAFLLPYFKKLIFTSIFDEFLINFLRSLQISSYLNNHNLKIALSPRKYPILNTSLIYASTRFGISKKKKHCFKYVYLNGKTVSSV